MKKLKKEAEMVLIFIQILNIVSLSIEIDDTIVFLLSKVLTIIFMIIIHHIMVKYSSLYN